MTQATQHHIMVGKDHWCDRTGSTAGMDINNKAGGVLCGHDSLKSALAGAKALRPHFRRGVVKIIAGPCPHSTNA